MIEKNKSKENWTLNKMPNAFHKREAPKEDFLFSIQQLGSILAEALTQKKTQPGCKSPIHIRLSMQINEWICIDNNDA